MIFRIFHSGGSIEYAYDNPGSIPFGVYMDADRIEVLEGPGGRVVGILKERQLPESVTIGQMQGEAWRHAEKKGFHAKQREMSPEVASIWVRLMLVVTELAEAAEVLRRVGSVSELAGPVNIKGEDHFFGSELADAVIRLGDLSEDLEINLQREVREKQMFNITRPHLHGEGKQA